MIEIPGYRLLRQLGRGGMATVYLAVQESVDREVALKVMSPALLADPNFGERFLREARIAARLHHRHVVGIHDVGRAGDYHYIAMEYLAGGAVLPRDGRGRDVAFALRVVREIAGALAYAHAKGFVHRDVKPDNILLRDDGSAALTDFGIARALDATASMTRTGAVVGTPHYMSPEQARGNEIDGRADLYSLGIVLHELLVGRVPYHADDSLAIGIKHLTEPLPQLPTSLAALQPLLTRLLAKQPEDRFQTGDEVAAAIAAIERRRADGALPDLAAAAPPAMSARPAARTPPFESFAAVTPPPAGVARERAEPNLGRLDDVAAALDGNDRRGGRSAPPPPPPPRAARRGLGALVALLLLGGGVLAIWHYQDALRGLLPHTEFNDTLARAQQALDAGRLSGSQGDSARELFLAARAQDPDNDLARRGLEEVGRRLLARANEAWTRGDKAAARADLDVARELLGGGSAVDRLDQALKQDEARGNQIAQLLERARGALDAGRITGTDGAAALYRQVLDGDKDNALAQDGLDKSAAALAASARSAVAAGNLAVASAQADDIARILPAWPGLPELLGQIAQAREAARAALEATLDRAEAQVRAGHLADGDEAALALFRAALKEDPASVRAKAGLQQVAHAFIVQANAAIDDSNPGAAERLLDAAAALAPDLADLRVARVNLRELRERLEIGARRTPVTPQQSAQLRRLVADAARALAAGNLILPPGDSAYDKYRAALAIDPDAADALAGLAQLPARAKELFAQALHDGAPQRARALLDALRQTAPEDPALPALSERLAGAFLDQADARIGEGRRDDAARALNAARELSPHNARLAPLETRLRELGIKG